METNATLTQVELEMLRFPAGVSYDAATGIVSAETAELLSNAHGLLKLGAFNCRRVKAGVKVYGATEHTHNGYGSIWLGSITAAGMRRKATVFEVR